MQDFFLLLQSQISSLLLRGFSDSGFYKWRNLLRGKYLINRINFLFKICCFFTCTKMQETHGESWNQCTTKEFHTKLKKKI
jgi:hypothetical protein